MIGGRKPRPLHIKLIEGEPNKDRLNFDEPKAGAFDPHPPSILTGRAKKEWNRLVDELKPTGMLNRLDRMGLTNLCLAYARKLEAEKTIKKTGLLIKGSNGQPRANPLLAIARDAEMAMFRIMTEYGMTPSSRQRIRVHSQDEEEGIERYLTQVK